MMKIRVGDCYYAAVRERDCNTFGVVKITRKWKCYYELEGENHLLPTGTDGPCFSSPPFAKSATPTREEAKELCAQLSAASVGAYRAALNERRFTAAAVFDAADCAAAGVPRAHLAVADEDDSGEID